IFDPMSSDGLIVSIFGTKKIKVVTRQPYVLSQFMRLLPRYEFQRIVNKYKGDYHTKHFKCWDHLASMMIAHIRQECSLRDIDITLNAHASKLYHIGIKQCPKSTLGDANELRDYRIYEEFAKTLMHRARREYAKTELALEVDNAVYALDASTIDLTLSVYPWAKFRKTKGAIKMHAMLDLRGNLPAFLYITDGKVHDVKAAPYVPIEPEGIYIVDRAYVDFSWLWSIQRRGAFFVTRLKKAIKWTRIFSHPVDKSLGLRSDQEILLASKKSKNLYPERLRRVTFRDETKARTLVFLTNNFVLSSETIAALYKARWEIELFFKWIKQNLKIKTFLGTSPNAVKIQIWIAMVVYLVIAILKERYHLDFAMSKLLHFLEVNLFEQKPLLSIFQINPRYERYNDDKQLTLFAF
ncbi:MAG: IS4 family transposase, partial [Anaerolineales bacterium]|nr:IS4 family transposase [Anaerolineales bacterium]